MTITLGEWMLIPALITFLAVIHLIREASESMVTMDDIKGAATIWFICMLISLLSIWSAS